jgi:hypothetical protein
MNKIVYNCCYGGFGLSVKAIIEIFKRKYNKKLFFYKKTDESLYKSWDDEEFERISEEQAILLDKKGEVIYITRNDCGDILRKKDPIFDKFQDGHVWEATIERHDPILVEVVEELGPEANGHYADLKVFETESDRYRIDEYDGAESVVTPEMEQYILIK